MARLRRTCKRMKLTLQQMVDEVRAGLQEKLRVRGRSLEAQIKRAGRQLPRRVRGDATYLAQALLLSENPKLLRMVDMAKARQAHQNVLAFLKTIDLTARRWTAFLSVIASIAFGLLVTGGLLLFILWARGFV